MAAAHTMYRMMADGNNGTDVRNELIIQELPQVHYIASRIHERLPRHVELHDLVSAGVIGLLEAYSTFDHAKSVQFRTYAKFRIRGAILDSLRSLDWGSRSIREKAREISRARAHLEGTLGRHPSTDEIAAEMHVSTSRLHEVQAELNGLHIVNREVPSKTDSDEYLDLIESAPSTWDNPFDAYSKVEDRGPLIRAASTLSEREQMILSLYYQEELTMKEVAQVVGIAVSRVSQIHAAALLKLKTLLSTERPQPCSPQETGGAK